MFLHHFVHIPWTQPDAWRVLPRDMREDLFEGILANDIVAFHTRSYRRNFLLCCRELFDLDVDEEAGVVRIEGREVWVRAYPLPDLRGDLPRNGPAAPRCTSYEREILRRRREHLILRVDRADLSKNILRGFTAFDLFLEQHPEFREQVTFIAHLIPSRQDVAEYAEYLERIEALVAVVNHRHGTTDWMPIDLRLRENLEEAIAAYKHYDLLMVNAMFDGMNLIAKEGPLVNERNGVSLLSENTGAHEELAEFALSVNPFDVQEQADAIHRALTMSADERSWRAQGLKRIVDVAQPGRLGRRPAGRHRGQARGRRGAAVGDLVTSAVRVGRELARAVAGRGGAVGGGDAGSRAPGQADRRPRAAADGGAGGRGRGGRRWPLLGARMPAAGASLAAGSACGGRGRAARSLRRSCAGRAAGAAAVPARGRSRAHRRSGATAAPSTASQLRRCPSARAPAGPMAPSDRLRAHSPPALGTGSAPSVPGGAPRCYRGPRPWPTLYDLMLLLDPNVPDERRPR